MLSDCSNHSIHTASRSVWPTRRSSAGPARRGAPAWWSRCRRSILGGRRPATAGVAERRQPYYVLARRLRSASELEVSNHDEAESASLLVPRWARMPQGFRAFAFLLDPCAPIDAIRSHTAHGGLGDRVVVPRAVGWAPELTENAHKSRPRTRSGRRIPGRQLRRRSR